MKKISQNPKQTVNADKQIQNQNKTEQKQKKPLVTTNKPVIKPKNAKVITTNKKNALKKSTNQNKSKTQEKQQQQQQQEIDQKENEQQIQQFILKKIQEEEAASLLLQLQQQQEEEEKNAVKGFVKLKYNHYIEEFETKNYKLKQWQIDEKFELSQSYKGKFQIKITIPPLTQKSTFLELNQEEEEFQNLENGQTYMIMVQEDNEIQEEERKKLKLYKQIHLTEMLSTILCIKDMDKSSLIVETDNKCGQFFKYKDNVINISDMKMKEQLLQQTREESQEQARQQILWAMRSGSKCIILMEKQLHNLDDFFKGCKFYQPEKLFIPSQYTKPEYYKNQLLYHETENIDYVGTKGEFKPRDDYSINIAYFDTEKDVKLEQKLEEFQKVTGFDSSYFKVIHIDPDQNPKNKLIIGDNKCPIRVNKNHTDLLDLVEQAYTTGKVI